METQLEKVSYIIGRQIGGDFKTQGLDLNMDIFAGAVMSAFKGEDSKITQEETQNVMTAFQTEMQAKMEEMQSRASEINLKEAAAFLEANKAKDGVKTTPTGLQYKVLTAGAEGGAKATMESQVECHYEGTLIDGTVFDSSYKRGQTATFPVAGVIAGWTEALQLMSEGDVWELVIPSALAYGEQGAGAQIGPGATLVFKVELVKVL